MKINIFILFSQIFVFYLKSYKDVKEKNDLIISTIYFHCPGRIILS